MVRQKKSPACGTSKFYLQPIEQNLAVPLRMTEKKEAKKIVAVQMQVHEFFFWSDKHRRIKIGMQGEGRF